MSSFKPNRRTGIPAEGRCGREAISPFDYIRVMATRSLHRRSLDGLPAVDGTSARSPGLDDADGMAKLMLAAYEGTIDYEGETIAEAREAVAEYLSEQPLLDCSLVVPSGGDLTAAVLASLWTDDQPLISYAMTAPTSKRTGLATSLLGSVLTALAAHGYRHVHAVITDGNTASERLFRAAGFEVVDWAIAGN